jgi:molecular chaperone GrpE
MEQENADVPAGTVLQVFQVGYLIEDRCLRPAMVVVSKGGPKAAKQDTPEAPPAA